MASVQINIVQQFTCLWGWLLFSPQPSRDEFSANDVSAVCGSQSGGRGERCRKEIEGHPLCYI